MNHKTQTDRKVVEARLTLDVTYFLNGEAADDMLANLQRRCEQAIGNGMLTGDTAAEVHRHEISTTLLPEPLSEDEIFDYMYGRIANGELSLEDTIDRLVCYGLMESHAFVAEMRERMGLTADD